MLYHWKLECRHDANFVAIGGMCFHNDNHWCHQWRQSWQHDENFGFKCITICVSRDKTYMLGRMYFVDISNL